MLCGISPDKLCGISPDKLCGISPDKLCGISPEKLCGISPDKLCGISPDKLCGISPDKLCGRSSQDDSMDSSLKLSILGVELQLSMELLSCIGYASAETSPSPRSTPDRSKPLLNSVRPFLVFILSFIL